MILSSLTGAFFSRVLQINNMIPSQLFTLADEARYNGFEDEDNYDLTALAYAMELEDDCNAISDAAMDFNYGFARRCREDMFA